MECGNHMNHPRIDVIKAGGRRPTEEFDPEKLHKSIVATCQSLNVPDGQSDNIARSVCLEVIRWCGDRAEITSSDIRRVGTEIFKKHHPEAAYLYKQQLMVL